MMSCLVNHYVFVPSMQSDDSRNSALGLSVEPLVDGINVEICMLSYHSAALPVYYDTELARRTL